LSNLQKVDKAKFIQGGEGIRLESAKVSEEAPERGGWKKGQTNVSKAMGSASCDKKALIKNQMKRNDYSREGGQIDRGQYDWRKWRRGSWPD